MHDATPRRGFLGSLVGAIALPHLIGEASAQTPQASNEFDMSWVDRVTGRHRQVFDAPEVADGTVLHQARTWMQGFKQVYSDTDADCSAVLVIRHAAVPIVLSDELWDRLELGKATKLKDPTTGKEARRNPFINVQRGDKYALVWSDGGLDKLLERGAIVLACGLAVGGIVFQVSEKLKMERAAARTYVYDNLVKGTLVMPSGIFAVGRAQEAGCHYIRST